MVDGVSRYRMWADDYFAVLVVSLVVVLLLGGYVTYGAHATTDTRTETRTVSTWQSSGEFTHRATVVNEVNAFAEGEVLRGRSVYFRDATPRLNGSFTYGYTATEGGNMTANVSVDLVLRSVEERSDGPAQGGSGGNETVLWQVKEPLGNTTEESLAPGDAATTSFSTNVSSTADRATAIDEQLGGTPGTLEILLRARVDLSGTRNGESVDRSRVYSLPISTGTGVYRVEDPGTVTDSGERTERVEVPVTPGPLRRFGGPLLLVLSLAGLAGLAYARSEELLTVSETERSRLAYQRQREEYDEWTSTGMVPASYFNRPTVRVESLEDLVDIAIDTDRRVIDDTDSERFVVLGDGVNYTYTPPR